MSQSDETMKIPGSGNDRASEARAKIAALSDSHLDSDHPLLGKKEIASASPRSDGSKPAVASLGHGSPLSSPVSQPKNMPAEWVSHKRKIRPMPSKARPIISAVASFLLLLLVFKSEVVISQIKYWTTKTKPAVQTQVQNDKPEVGPAPIIQIPKIDVKAPVVYESSISEPAIQKALQRGVVHYGTSPRPGEPGNSVIVGHSSNDFWEPGKYKFVFVLLDKLIVGDKFSVNYKGKRYVYKVASTKVVEPTDLSVLAQTSKPSMTLITCTPPGTSWRRLVVKADQISPAPQTVHKAPPQSIEGSIAKLPSNAPDFIDQVWQFIKSLLDRLARLLD